MQKTHPIYKRITLDPEVCFGAPCIRGLRMPISSILGYLASGMTAQEILREWPDLQPEDINEALAYAAWAMTERRLAV